NQGSMFILYLPAAYTPPRTARKLQPPGSESPGSLLPGRSAPTLKSTPTTPTPTGPGALQRQNDDRAGGDDTADGNGRLSAAALLDQPPVEPKLDLLVNEVGDDRDDLLPGDRVLLIVENDLGFARFLLDIAREKGFKGLVTSLGAATLALTREYKPHA